MKKKSTLLIIVMTILFNHFAVAQGVGINASGAAADASAMLDVSSTTQGFLVPRMTQAQKNNIASPANGLLIYQTNASIGFWFNYGTPASPDWRQIGGDITAGTGINVTGNTVSNTGVLTFSAGTTGLTPTAATNGAVTLAGTLNVANGGTSRATLTANSLLAGNGTGAVNLIAPGAAGNVLVSNGTAWTSGNVAGNFIQNQSAAAQAATFWINGVGRVGDGTAAVPSLSFNSNAATGLFRAGAHILGFSTNGAERWRIDAAGILQSNGAQTIRTSTGNLTIATAAGDGDVILTPNGTGRVLVGTTTQVAFDTESIKLQVHGNIGLTSGSIHTIYGNGRLRIGAYGNRNSSTDDLSDDIVFMTTTSKTNRMMIKNDGKVSIGDDYYNPPNRLSVRDGLAGYVMRVENTRTTGGDHVIDCVGGGTNGDFFIAFRRTSNSAIIGSISRDGASNVAFNTSSDIRLKENIKESVNGLSIVNKLRVVDYNFIEDSPNNRVTGFIAQEAYNILPSIVHVGGENVSENPWSIDYGKLTPYLTKAIQEQQAMIDEQQKIIQEQYLTVQKLMNVIEKQQNSINLQQSGLNSQQDRIQILEQEYKLLKTTVEKSANSSSKEIVKY